MISKTDIFIVKYSNYILILAVIVGVLSCVGVKVLYYNVNGTPSKIRIASFNIQTFGKAKASNPIIMDTLAGIISQYDIIAIQEIRDKSGYAIQELQKAVNKKGTHYNMSVGPRLGRTKMKEQYAYFYRDIITMTSSYTYSEPCDNDQFHREPYISRFVLGAIDLVLITVHIDPEEAPNEVRALNDVLDNAKAVYPFERDFIILGDLNADCRYYNEDTKTPINGMAWVLGDNEDTTVRSTDCTYDRIIASKSLKGKAGVHRFDIQYGLTQYEALVVSDHYPIFFEL